MRKLVLVVCAGALAVASNLAGAASLRLDFTPSPRARLMQRIGQSLTLTRCKTPPKIDGDLTDAAWREAAVIKRFSADWRDPALTGHSKQKTPPTRAWVSFDDKALYVAVDCTNMPGRTAVATSKGRDASMRRDDRVAISVQPNRKSSDVFVFSLNPANAFSDEARGERGRDIGYNPDWFHAVKRTPKGWTLEAAIPLKALGMKKFRSQMGFDIGRTIPGVGFSGWVASRFRFNANKKRGFLVLTDVPETRDGPLKEKRQGLAVVGDTLAVTAGRSFARPQDRWFEASLAVWPKSAKLENCRVRARLFAIGETKPIDEVLATPQRQRGRLLANVRQAGGKDVRLTVELFEGEKRTGLIEQIIRVQSCEKPLNPGQRIEVKLSLPEGLDTVSDWPVTFGVPFAAGALWDADALRLVNAAGKEIPCQKEVTGTWASEGAIKWVRFDALVSTKDGCFVEFTPAGATAQLQTPLKLTEQDGAVIIDTGVARYVIGKGSSPIKEISIGGKAVATAANTRGLYVIDQKDRLASASAEDETMTIEARGPLAACVRLEGFYRTAGGEQLARHITRVEAFAGQPFANITHTLILTNDTNKIWFKDIGWEFAVTPGAAPKALFGASRADWKKSHVQPLDRTPAAFMFQDKHFRFSHGTSHFSIATLDNAGKAATQLEGEECGDWAALSGAGGGLAWSCKDAARQHPKEFEIRRDRYVLHLFSNRAGEELDFRTETLIKKWDVPVWYMRTYGKKKREDVAGRVKKEVAGYHSNAIGWAKTHNLRIEPLARDTKADVLAKASRLHSKPLYALADPTWICASAALIPLHPKDPENFPILEKIIEKSFDREVERLEEWGDYGFMDYAAGPHYRIGDVKRRFGVTYTIREDLWTTYARSGDRRIRTFSEAHDATYMDSYFCHWDGDARIQGLYTGSNKPSLPFYWGGSAMTQKSSKTNFNKFIWMYHLTGYRRAGDHIREYIDGIKRFWSPGQVDSEWRIIMGMRLMMQAYGFTWDPELRAMCDATADIFMDVRGDLGLARRSYGAATYKTNVDVRVLMEGWDIFGATRYRDAALKIAQYWWEAKLGAYPIYYVDPQGTIGNFLYRHTGDPHYAEGLALLLAQVRTLYDPKTGGVAGQGRAGTTFIFEGIPQSQAVVMAAGGPRKGHASWVGFENFGQPVSIVIQKDQDEPVNVDVKLPSTIAYGQAGGVIRLDPAPYARAKQPFNSLREKSSRVASVYLGKDTYKGSFKVTPQVDGVYFALAHSNVPMVVHAPAYWKPMPTAQPNIRWYFRLPEKSRDAQIFFEGSAIVFDPEGKKLDNGRPQQGWVNLPADKPGLWSFEAVVNMLVKARNFPPFFAPGDPKRHFVPPIPWQREDVAAGLAQPDPKTIYADGAIGSPGDKALYLTGLRQFILKGGKRRASGDGCQFLPLKQGTIEFYMKPTWSTFDLPQKTRKMFFSMDSSGKGWQMMYIKDPKKNWRYPSHNLYADFYYGNRGRTPTTTKMIFRRDRWIHVAWVWGMRDDCPTNSGPARLMATQLFIDGKPATARLFRKKTPPSHIPTLLRMLPSIDAAVDELRISDVQRYIEPFAPPQGEHQADKHTRALFHFNGNLKGEHHGAGTLTGMLKTK
jgi:PcRGLX-like protein central beta sandwich domain/PcRGLX-like N-terminal RIFT barrel domain/Carbohydrate family 9 binding domain-like